MMHPESSMPISEKVKSPIVMSIFVKRDRRQLLEVEEVMAFVNVLDRGLSHHISSVRR